MFDIKQRGSTVGTEILSGFTTFLTVAYILFLNPKMLSDAGMPAADVVAMIAIGGAICAVLMGLVANLPYVLAPGVGMTAFFAYDVVLGHSVSWQVALAASLCAGFAFFVLSLFGIRDFLYMAIPKVVRMATMVGIGLFLTLIGFENAGLTVAHKASLITLGNIGSPAVLMALLGLLIMSALMAWHVRSAILIGIISVTAIAWIAGFSAPPSSWIAWPTLTGKTLFAMDFGPFFTATFFQIALAFFVLASLDLTGTLSGINRLAGIMDADGKIFGSKAAYAADGAGIMLSSALGTSPNTVFVESAVGMQVGGRTGLTALTIGALFLLSLFFIPVFTAIPSFATAPALIVVGAMMMRGASDLDWTKVEDIIPAFLTIACMAFTFNIAHGLAFGLISYVLLNALRGRWNQLNWAMVVFGILLMLYLVFNL